MIKAIWNEDMQKVLVNLKTDGEHFQKEYVAVVTSAIKILRDSGYSDDDIEHLLVEAINDGFNNLEDIQELRK